MKVQNKEQILSGRNAQIMKRRFLCQSLLISGGLEGVGIDHLDLSVRSYNALIRSGRRTVSDLIRTTPNELREIKNLSRDSVREVETVLADMGLQLKAE